ncbi:MAG TPA: imidazolonepropionase [Actinomycetota bacterium]|nr:imidazolonepropionase [Actinomycetota bacterium]
MARGAAVAATLATARGPLPARGAAATAEVFSPGAVSWDDDGTIVFVGPADDLPEEPVTLGRVDEGTIVPGFVDCHVHLPFVGWRADEYEARLAGVSYRDLHGREGGIFRSARMLAEAEDEEVLAFSKALLGEMAGLGTTATELKSGYGLSVEGELRQLRLARRLADAAAQTCAVTLLAWHAVPEGRSREEWVGVACDELIPAAAADSLADAVDIYVEDIAFSLEDLERVAAAASAAGLPLRVHADQLGPSGAAEAAAPLGARSVDHLNHVSEAGVAALGGADTAAVLLPASTFTLRAPPPPVAALRDAGAALAIATDLNPGTSPVCSMPEAIAFACSLYAMSPTEALVAATANPAWVLGLHNRLGTLEVGKRADVLLLDGPTFAHVPYRPGHDPVTATVIGGDVVEHRDGSMPTRGERS